MIDISRYFKILFGDPDISAEELRQFGENHLGKTKGLNATGAEAGQHTAMIALTQSLFDAFDGALSARADALATAEGGTVSKDDAVRLFKTRVRQRSGRILDKFGRDSAQYEEFFPRGLREFNNARMGQIKALMDRMIEKAMKYSAQLDPAMAAEFTTLRDQFVDARDGQVGGAGTLAEVRKNVSETRAALEKQLTLNLLDLARKHLGAPERAADYFTQSLLEDPTRQNEDTPPAPPQP